MNKGRFTKENASEFGKRGGASLVKKRGNKWMRKIIRLRWKRYREQHEI